MMVRNDWTPIVILVVLLLAGACLFGMVSSGSELFNTTGARQGASAQATQEGIVNQGRQANMRATETALAATQAYEGILNESAKAPAQATLQADRFQATLNADRAQATQMAFQRQVKADENQARFNTASQVAAVAAALFVAGILLFLTIQLGMYLRADAIRRGQEVEARLLEERRLIEQVRATIAAQATRPIPAASPVRETGGAKAASTGNVKTPVNK